MQLHKGRYKTNVLEEHFLDKMASDFLCFSTDFDNNLNDNRTRLALLEAVLDHKNYAESGLDLEAEMK